MELKKDIQNLLESLKRHGYDRSAIEERLGLANNSIDQNLSRGGTKKLKTSLQLLVESILQNATSQNGHEKTVDLVKELKAINEWQIGVDATLSVLMAEISPLIAKQTGKSHAAVFSQMKKDIADETLNRIRSLSR